MPRSTHFPCRTHVELLAAGVLNDVSRQSLVSSLEKQLLYVYRRKYARPFACPMGGHSFTLLEALGGDVAVLDERLDNPQPESDDFTCPHCSARVHYVLPFIGEEYLALVPGQQLAAAAP